MTNNADAQIAREWARRAVESAENAQPVSRGALAAARHILATTTPPTMADVAWDNEVHAGLVARHYDGDLVRMIAPSLDDPGEYIQCAFIPAPGRPLVAGELHKTNLTPLPGTRVDLTPRREPEPEPESTPEPEQPRPEDVKPDPQPGEAWLIEYEGKRYEAIYWHSALYAHWSFVRNREGTVYIESHEAIPVSRLVPERGDVS